MGGLWNVIREYNKFVQAHNHTHPVLLRLYSLKVLWEAGVNACVTSESVQVIDFVMASFNCMRAGLCKSCIEIALC